MVRQTNRNTVVGPTADIKPGALFKAGKHWYWAIDAAVPATPHDSFDFKVRAYERHGVAVWVFVYGQEVEHARPGWRPATFTPSAILRAARLKEDQANAMLSVVGRMRALAGAVLQQGKP